MGPREDRQLDVICVKREGTDDGAVTPFFPTTKKEEVVYSPSEFLSVSVA